MEKYILERLLSGCWSFPLLFRNQTLFFDKIEVEGIGIVLINIEVVKFCKKTINSDFYEFSSFFIELTQILVDIFEFFRSPFKVISEWLRHFFDEIDAFSLYLDCIEFDVFDLFYDFFIEEHKLFD